jgi:hypothetical protein
LPSNTLERLKCLSIEITFWIFRGVVREEVVGEKVCCSVDCKVCYWSGPVVSVGRNRVLVSLATEGMHNCQVVTIRTDRHGDELLELGKVERDWVATTAG